MQTRNRHFYRTMGYRLKRDTYICTKIDTSMKRLLLAALLAAGMIPASGWAQDFDQYFTNKTLRIDYLFSGNAKTQNISVDELSSLPGWAGRRHSLNQLPAEGNGQITMTDSQTGTVIYRTSFSSLFQEWQSEEEAKHVTRGFENTFLVPYPKQEAIVTIELKDVYHHTSATLSHHINPNDILIHQRGTADITPHRYLLKSGSEDKCIDLAIMAEGYTEAEMDVFYKDAQTACDALFEHEPFKSMKDKFNVVAVASPSKDSGVSIPRENQWKNTAVSSHFDTFYSDRYLTTRSVKAIHNWLAGIPYEHIIILANTDTYGGGGIYNSYLLTTAHHPKFRPVVVHEFGHSFAGLADEYAYENEPSGQYPYSVEPWEANITTLVDFESKWKDMLPKGTPIPTPPATKEKDLYTKVGVYEGGGYTLKGIYRPTTECRMKINEAPQFCPVCIRALQKMIHFYTD